MCPASESNDVALHPGRGAPSVGQDREGFRPVALPALAAAVHVAASAAKAARDKLLARAPRPFVHEDDPTA